MNSFLQTVEVAKCFSLNIFRYLLILYKRSSVARSLPHPKIPEIKIQETRDIPIDVLVLDITTNRFLSGRRKFVIKACRKR